MYTFLSPASWILALKIPQVGPTFRNMAHMDFKTLSFPPKDGFFSIQFFLVKNDLMQENRNNFAGFDEDGWKAKWGIP